MNDYIISNYGVVINGNIRMYYTISTNNDMISYESIWLYYSSLTIAEAEIEVLEN
jgi:hypothetical protein